MVDGPAARAEGGGREPSLDRLAALSDGVFAVALTLLALDLRVPSVANASAHKLLAALGGDWPRFATFALSFVLVGEVWVNAHRMWTHIVRSDHWLIWLNLLLLLDIVVIPFATSLLAEYARQLGAREVAALVYGGTWTFGGLVYNAIWWRAVHRRLVGPGTPSALTWRWGLGPALYGISTLLALVSVPLSLAGFALMAFVYLLPLPAPAPRE